MITECKTDPQILATFPVMQQLRPHFTEADAYLAQVNMMMNAHGYRLIGYFSGDICIGAIGFTTETRLFCGKMIYVADLVTDDNQRSQGVGKALLDWLKTEATQLECSMVQLDSGTHRAAAHRFYFREGFDIQAFNFRWSA